MGPSFFGHYIPAVGLSNLHRYKYSSGGYTPLDRAMTPFWEWVARRVPVYVHPNVITLVGVVSALLGVTLQLWHTPHLSEAAPSWVYFVAAFLFFLQQTCDAIDGKHARRNGMSSPLGQLFDHGGDIMLTTPMALASIAFITAGTSLLPHIIAMASSQFFQFIYMWWELHYHVFYAATGSIGVTEAQWGVIVMALISGCFGPWVWRYDLLKLLPASSKLKQSLSSIAFLFGVEVNGVLLVQVLLVICNLWALVYNVAAGICRAPKPALAASHILSFLSFLTLQAALWNWWLGGEGDFSTSGNRLSPLLLYLTMTTSYSILLLRICLSATCRFPFRLLHWPLLPFALAAAAFLAVPACRQHRGTLFLGVSAWNILYLADFLRTCVGDVCQSLGICCFRVDMTKAAKKKEEEAAAKSKKKNKVKSILEEDAEEEEEEAMEEKQGRQQPRKLRRAKGLRETVGASDEEGGGRRRGKGQTQTKAQLLLQQQQGEEGGEGEDLAAAAGMRPRVTRAAKEMAGGEALGKGGEFDAVNHYQVERRKGA